MRWLSGWSVILLAAAWASAAFGETSSADMRAAETHTVRGRELFEQRSWDAAMREFHQAHALDPVPDYLCYIAACHGEEGRVTEALRLLDQALDEGPRVAAMAEFCRELRTELAARPGSVEIESTPPGAEIHVDGRSTGHVTPHTLGLPVGSHVVTLRIAGHLTREIAVTVSPGGRERVSAELEARPSTPPPAPWSTEAEPPPAEPPALVPSPLPVEPSDAGTPSEPEPTPPPTAPDQPPLVTPSPRPEPPLPDVRWRYGAGLLFRYLIVDHALMNVVFDFADGVEAPLIANPGGGAHFVARRQARRWAVDLVAYVTYVSYATTETVLIGPEWSDEGHPSFRDWSEFHNVAFGLDFVFAYEPVPWLGLTFGVGLGALVRVGEVRHTDARATRSSGCTVTGDLVVGDEEWAPVDETEGIYCYHHPDDAVDEPDPEIWAVIPWANVLVGVRFALTSNLYLAIDGGIGAGYVVGARLEWLVND